MNKERKGVFLAILISAISTVAFGYALFNFSDVLNFLKKILTVLSPLIYGFCIAYVINTLLMPLENLYDKIIRHKRTRLSNGIKRGICLLISLMLISGVICAILIMVIPELTETVSELFEMLPGFLENTEKLIGDILDKHNIIIPQLDFDAESFNKKILEILPKIGTDFVTATITLTTSVFSAALDMIVTVAFAIYMLLYKEKLCLSLKKLLYATVKKEYADTTLSYLDLINRTFSNFIQGQIIEAFIIGILCFIGMSVLRIPYAVTVSALVAVTALIPILGAYIGAFVGAFLIVIVSPVKALWFLIFLVTLQQLEGNLIYPKVVGNAVGLPGIFVLASITVGGNLFGIAGMLVAVPVTSILYTVIRQFVRKRLSEKEIRA